jgi:hypothetical protein
MFFISKMGVFIAPPVFDFQTCQVGKTRQVFLGYSLFNVIKLSILSRPERSGGHIEGCGLAPSASFDTRSISFRATQDACCP